MALLTLTDLGETMGVVFDPTSTAGKQAQRYIDKVTAYITNITKASFTPVVDEVLRCQADYYGEIELENEPITEVSSVVSFDDTAQTELLGSCVFWDGLNGISGLYPHQVVDVTMSHGYSAVPTDLANLATDVCIEALTGGNPSEVQSLTVGDRTQEFRNVIPMIEKLGEEILASYRTTERSWRLGPKSHPYPRNILPTL